MRVKTYVRHRIRSRRNRRRKRLPNFGSISNKMSRQKALRR